MLHCTIYMVMVDLPINKYEVESKENITQKKKKLERIAKKTGRMKENDACRTKNCKLSSDIKL